MKNVNITVLSCGVVALLAAFFPLATKGVYFIDIQHLGGIATLLYVIPVFVIIPAVLALNGVIHNLKAWYLPVGIIGFLVSVIASYSAMGQVAAFSNFTGRSLSGGTTFGFGSLTLLLVYNVIFAAPYFGKKPSELNQERQQQ